VRRDIGALKFDLIVLKTVRERAFGRSAENKNYAKRTERNRQSHGQGLPSLGNEVTS
jgi:hypothetical protein